MSCVGVFQPKVDGSGVRDSESTENRNANAECGDLEYVPVLIRLIRNSYERTTAGTTCVFSDKGINA